VAVFWTPFGAWESFSDFAAVAAPRKPSEKNEERGGILKLSMSTSDEFFAPASGRRYRGDNLEIATGNI